MSIRVVTTSKCGEDGCVYVLGKVLLGGSPYTCAPSRGSRGGGDQLGAIGRNQIVCSTGVHRRDTVYVPAWEESVVGRHDSGEVLTYRLYDDMYYE